MPIIRGILAATLALALFAAPAKAETPGQCQSIAIIRSTVGPAIAPAGGTIEVLMGPDSVAYLAVINAEPPVSDMAGEGVILIVLPSGVTIGLIKGDQACVAAKIGPDVHARAMLAVQGHRA